MRIPRPIWWLIVIGAPVAAVVGLSMLALDKPNVVWSADAAQRPLCPHCRTPVPMYARRCPTCREEFDWVPSPEEDSAWCRSCLASEESRFLRARRKALGEEESAKRAAVAMGATADVARGWLKSMSAGLCGWCGGSGRNGDGSCPVCFGEGRCIVCDETLRVRRGSERAGREWERMVVHWRNLSRRDADVDVRRLVREEEAAFLKHNVGTFEASLLPFWPDVSAEPQQINDSQDPSTGPKAAWAARRRVTQVLQALEK